MGAAGERGEILARALGYPYDPPRRSFVWNGGEPGPWPLGGPDRDGRRPLLAYGSNAAPATIARKLGPVGGVLPVQRAELSGFDVVYSAHLSAYGAVPATLLPSPGTTVGIHVLWTTEAQAGALAATEPNYSRRSLRARLRLDDGTELELAEAFLSRHGALVLDGSPAALGAAAAAGRRHPELAEPEVLERVRALLAPESGLAEFVAAALDPRRAAAWTAALRERHSVPARAVD